YNEIVGSSGTGIFMQSGGTNSVVNAGLFGTLYLGYNAGGSGTYSLSGGQLVASNEYAGSSGAGTFVQSGGTNSVGTLYLGYNAGSGTYSLSGSGQLAAAFEYVGSSGTGTFTQTGGTSSIGTLCLGNSAGSVGTYTLSGSGQISAVVETVGNTPGATALFQQTGGTNTVSLLSIGTGGMYMLAGGSLQVNGLASQGIFAGGATPVTLSV